MVAVDGQGEGKVECIKVLVRVRPFLAGEGRGENFQNLGSQLNSSVNGDENHKGCLQVDNGAVTVRGGIGNTGRVKEGNLPESHSFKFDEILGGDSTQEHVFEKVILSFLCFVRSYAQMMHTIAFT